MKTITLIAAACALTLGACGGTTNNNETNMDPDVPNPPVNPGLADSISKNSNGSILVVKDGQQFDLPATSLNLNGQPGWISNDLRANGFEDSNVLAIGGVQDGTAFSGIDGTVIPPGGDATFVGRYAVNNVDLSGGSISGNLTTNYNFGTGALTGATGDFSVDGTVDVFGAATGTVTYAGETADFKGGLYLNNTVAGAFNNDTFGGIFYGAE